MSGVKLPFYTEEQWYTRDRVMRIQDVQINLEVADELFAVPMPAGMASFLVLAGDWKVALQTRQQPGQPWTDSERESKIESLMGGALIRETFENEQGATLRTLSYDQFQERYRMTEFDSVRNQMDVQEGTLAEGRLELSNAETGTTWTGFGMTFHTRTAYSELGKDRFLVEQAISIDGGESWFVAAKATYTRAEQE